MKSRKLRRKEKPPMPTHERIASELPRNVPVRFIEVSDPYEAGGKIIVAQSMRDDPLGRLHCRGQIDDAQYNAGRDMQSFYERAEVGNVKAMDTTKEPVDGGGFPDPINESQWKARDKVLKLELALGKEGASIVRDFLAQRMFIEQIAAKRRMSGDREIRYLGRRLRECLESLAKELKYA